MGKELARRFEREALPCHDRLYRVALALTRSRADAEDLVQETLARACAAFGGFRAGTNIGAWLHRIMVNSFINGYRKRRREPVVLSGSVDDLAACLPPPLPGTVTRSAEAQALDRLLTPELTRAVRQLPAEFATVVYLTDVEGFSYKETAQYMGTPVGTVMSRLHRGRQALRARLAADDPAPPQAAVARRPPNPTSGRDCLRLLRPNQVGALTSHRPPRRA
jgi:RNA polymerase sigma-70 factor (ECF subfamily)